MSPEKNRPLVSYVVIAYNQEKYIKKSIDSAFSQSYSPLEIILSDDCSKDDTFRIMQNASENYSGKHKVIIRRNKINLNIGGHIRSICKDISGDIVVMAAGDDISHSTRVAEHIELYNKNNTIMAVFSDAIIFQENGVVNLYKAWHSNAIKKISKKQIIFWGGGVGKGATFSYRKTCFNTPYEYPEFYHSEDKLLPLRACLLGDVFYLPKPLVDVRRHESSVSHSPTYIRSRSKKIYRDELIRNVDFFEKKGYISKKEKNRHEINIKKNYNFWARVDSFEGNSLKSKIARVLLHISYQPLDYAKRRFFFYFQSRFFRF